jgi:hypothetical protein
MLQALATTAWMCGRFHWLPAPEQRLAWEEAVWAKRQDVNTIETANIMFRWAGPPGRIQVCHCKQSQQ